MKKNEADRKIEEEYLSSTLSIIKDSISQLNVSLRSNIEDTDSLKQYMWENRKDLDSAEFATEMQRADAAVVRANKYGNKIRTLLRAEKMPYFGRIDFSTNRNNKITLKIYVGIVSIKNKTFQHYVYDWRAPICSMFYDFETGASAYDAPSGKIEGIISLKRQYKIENSVLVRYFDCEININDDFLQEVLSQNSSSKLRNIVKTIQREQNTIIRNINDKRMIIQGIAGSGKTTVALHRIAYLLYKEKNITSNNILIFSPNEIFTEYIADVLPELGERNVLQTTFADFASSYIKKKSETLSEFIERYYSVDKIDENVKKIIEFKFSSGFRSLLNEFAQELTKSLHFKGNINVSGTVFEASRLNELINTEFVDIPIREIVINLSKYLCDYSNADYEKSGKYIIKELSVMLKVNTNFESLYYDVLNSDKFREAVKIHNTKYTATGNKFVTYEDTVGMLYLRAKLIGFPKNFHIKHVVIDEAQDYVPMQFDILNRIFPNAKFTILGDVNQTINPYYHYNSLNGIGNVFHEEGLGYKYYELNSTYRSSKEIVDFTNSLLNLRNVSAIRHRLDIPVTIKDVKKVDITKELKSDIKRINGYNFKRVVIITKTQKIAEALRALLFPEGIEAEIADANEHQNLIASDKLLIMPSYTAKGLEFDAVILLSMDKKEYMEYERQLYYVICSRALHSLTIYNPPEFVP